MILKYDCLAIFRKSELLSDIFIVCNYNIGSCLKNAFHVVPPLRVWIPTDIQSDHKSLQQIIHNFLVKYL